jgi:hypothetical protein
MQAFLNTDEAILSKKMLTDFVKQKQFKIHWNTVTHNKCLNKNLASCCVSEVRSITSSEVTVETNVSAK